MRKDRMIVGNSKPALEMLENIETTAKSGLNPILITGDRGTGKELAARHIHAMRTPHGPFVAVNCAAISEGLLESEIFGHVAGAFTGATGNRAGAIRAARQGTLLLDEISEMDVRLQAKLLRLLDGYGFKPVGSDEQFYHDCTIIATSNRNLDEYKGFRADLLDRLRVGVVRVPSLWERRDDIPALVQKFLRQRAGISADALQRLVNFSWPGNIRELKNIIERAVALCIRRNIIGLNIIDRLLVEPRTVTKDCNLSRAEAGLIREALRQTRNQKTEAAKALGISRTTLYDKLRLHEIDVVKENLK